MGFYDTLELLALSEFQKKPLQPPLEFTSIDSLITQGCEKVQHTHPSSKFCAILLACEIAMFQIIQRCKKCIYWRRLFYITVRNLGPVSIVKLFEQSFKKYFNKTRAVPVPAQSLVLFFLKPLADFLDPFPDVPITPPCLKPDLYLCVQAMQSPTMYIIHVLRISIRICLLVWP